LVSCIVDCRISETELKSLTNLGLNIILCPKSSKLYQAISSHPDIQIFIFNKSTLVLQKEISEDFIDKLQNLNIKIISSQGSLTHNYPHDIILNCFLLGDLFIHNLNYTDNAIISLLDNAYKKIHVKQGYSKCSTAIVSPKAVITSDIGIAKALNSESVDVLFVGPGDIILEGMNYGFIGGCCGLLDEHNIAFFGSLDRYKYGKEIKDFLRKHKVEYHCLMDQKLTDRGSLFRL
jgi:hypothetical protein